MSKRIVIGKTETGDLSFSDDQLSENHFMIRGKTGERKTLFLLSLVKQYIRLVDHTLIYLDLGRDQAAFWILKEEAEKAGKPFYYFTLGPNDGCSWDPLGNTQAFASDLNEAANGLASGIKLEHPDGYGKTFFSRLNIAALNAAFDALVAKGGTMPPTFAQFAAELREQAKVQRGNNVSESSLAFDQLLRYPAIAEQGTNPLVLAKSIEQDAVVVFHLPPSPAARAVAALAHWCTTIEAADRVAKGKLPKTIHLGVDEFGVIAAGKSALANSLVLSRKWGVRHYMTFQNSDQMKTPDGDLNPVLRSQCQQVLFTSDPEEQEALRMESLDVEREETSETHPQLGIAGSTTTRTVLEPGLTRNEIIHVNGEAMKAFLVAKLGDKHRDPIPFTIVPPTSKAKHTELKNKPLPTISLQIDSGVENSEVPSPDRDIGYDERAEKLRELLSSIRTEEVWRMVG